MAITYVTTVYIVYVKGFGPHRVFTTFDEASRYVYRQSKKDRERFTIREATVR